MYQVTKRDGTAAQFEIGKISAAITKAFQALDKQFHPTVIDLLALRVTANFEPKIRDGRIAAAGCVLPLTNNTNLSPDLGTRHRAGIGMSEHSDAVIVIVSEETGGISIAVDGMLKRRLSPETFEAILRSELLPAEEQQRRRWDTFVDFVKKLNPLRREKQHDKKDDDQQNSRQ